MRITWFVWISRSNAGRFLNLNWNGGALFFSPFPRGQRPIQMALDSRPERSNVLGMKTLVVMLSGLMLLFTSEATVQAQGFTPAQLEQLVGPIALYPDPLIAEILPAASFPSQIVAADQYVNGGGDPNQITAQGWDPSVQALAHYANVLKWMDDNMAWSTQLGQAFQSQQPDVMNAIQQLRTQAKNLGNLPSTPQETVSDDDGDIEIDPTDADQMYVPTFDQDTIYSQAGVYCTFPYWLPLGGWLAYDWNWHSHGLIYWGPGHPRPGSWWHSTPGQRHSYIAGHSTMPVWHPGGGVAARGGWERGYEAPQINRTFARPGPAPSVTVIHSAPTTVRNVPAFHPSPAPSGGIFVGGQSGREAVQSSSRGQASRASMPAPPVREAAPVSRGFSGGGGGGGGRRR